MSVYSSTVSFSRFPKNEKYSNPINPYAKSPSIPNTLIKDTIHFGSPSVSTAESLVRNAFTKAKIKLDSKRTPEFMRNRFSDNTTIQNADNDTICKWASPRGPRTKSTKRPSTESGQDAENKPQVKSEDKEDGIKRKKLKSSKEAVFEASETASQVSDSESFHPFTLWYRGQYEDGSWWKARIKADGTVSQTLRPSTPQNRNDLIPIEHY